MSDRSSDLLRRMRRLVRNEIGSTLVLTAVGIVAFLGVTGVALEFGRAYLGVIRLSRAVDAGALAAVRSIRKGEEEATRQALSFAAANGVVSGQGGVDLSVAYGRNPRGEPTAEMAATMQLPLVLRELLQREALTLRSSATAAVPPVDLAMVLDQSGSLQFAAAWDDLQRASKSFVDEFSDDLDKATLISFSTRAALHRSLGHSFRSTLKTRIDGMRAFGATNYADGLRLAVEQMNGPNARRGAVKVVVLFTDGWPNTLRTRVNGRDRIISAVNLGSFVPPWVMGYWDNPDLLPTDRYVAPNGCANQGNCFGWTAQAVVDSARVHSRRWAQQLRTQGVYVYTIGMSDPSFRLDPAILQWAAQYGINLRDAEKPDMAFLRELANHEGMISGSQPKGKAYLATGPGDLPRVFEELANDILIHLAH